MRKIFLFIAVLGYMLQIQAQTVQQDGKPERRRIAVYITASESVHSDAKRVVNNQIIAVLNQTDKYVLIERNEDFAKQIDNERGIQQSGNVRDDQITDLAKEFGAVAVCIADLGFFMKELSVDMRMVSVTTKTIIPGRTGSSEGSINGVADIRKIVDNATAEMLSTSSGSSNSVSSQNNSANSDKWFILEDYNLMVMKKDVGSGTWSSINQSCKDIALGGYNDWRLPTQSELAILYLEKDEIGGFTNDWYWSSTPYYNYYFSYYWAQSFSSGAQGYDYSNNTNRGRCVSKIHP